MRQDQCSRLFPPLTAVATGLWLASIGPAQAHGSERGFVLLLPTGYYIVGGVAAVAASFLFMAALSPRRVQRLTAMRLPICTPPAISPVPTSTASFLTMALLLYAGLYGSRDPLANPLPLAVWTVWWVALTLAHAALGNLWAYLNPWSGPYRLLDRALGGRLSRAPPLAYPSWLGFWPAIAVFVGFAWFELVYPAPNDPERLAYVVGVYWVVAFTGIVLCGEPAWRGQAEPFSVFFRLIASLSPLVWQETAHGRLTAALAPPGATLARREPLPPSGVLLVLLTLSAVSFDGLSKTFWWLSLGDINPLEHPGRSALILRNSVGLLIAFVALAAAYASAAWLGSKLAGEPDRSAAPFGSFVLAILPISIAFHFSHYLTALLVNGQYALLAASDPFATGQKLLGVGSGHVTTAFLSTYGGVRTIWNLQTGAIVTGHIAGVVMAHAIALRFYPGRRQATLSHLPLAVLMVLYTWFGLWLLSTPVVG